MLETIILDLDGPLLNGKHRHYQCYRDILCEFGYVPIPMDRYWEMKREHLDNRTLLEMSDALSFYDDFSTLWLQKIERWEYLEKDRLQKGVHEILSRWKQTGSRLILATMRNNPDNLRRQIVSLGIHDFFDAIVVVGSALGWATRSSEVGKVLGDGEACHAIWIGDTEVDILSARDLGMKVCAVSCGLRNGAYLSVLSPDFLERNLSSFANKLGRARESLLDRF